MTQECLSGHWPGSSFEGSGTASTSEEGCLAEDCAFRLVALLSLSSLSEPWPSFFSLPPPAAFAKSKADPGVFGVFALPKPNAPLPSPKAEDAPEPVGEATEDVDIDPAPLKGLLLLLMLPNRFEEGVS